MFISNEYMGYAGDAYQDESTHFVELLGRRRQR
jgi:hypothetical protein